MVFCRDGSYADPDLALCGTADGAGKQDAIHDVQLYGEYYPVTGGMLHIQSRELVPYSRFISALRTDSLFRTVYSKSQTGEQLPEEY